MNNYTMPSKFTSLFLFAIEFFLPNFVNAQEVSQPRYSSVYQINNIKVQAIYDRTNESFVPFPKGLPNPYGLDMDLLIAVEIVQKETDTFLDFKTPLNIVIEADSYETQATGYVPAWKEIQTRYLQSSNSQKFSIPFLVEYQCYPRVKLTAILGTEENSQKVIYFSLPCAE